MADDSLYSVANTHSVASGEGDLGDKVMDFVTKGIPLAAASGVTSILNTAISLGNAFGGDSKQINLTKEIRDYDDDLSKYYEAHKENIDLGGFIGTSLVPGSLGVRGLKALQTVKSGEGIGKNTYTVAGYFAGKQQKYLEAAAETIKSPLNNVFAKINGDKLAAVATGYGEQFLQGAVFETAVLLSMNQNPILEPADRGYFQNIIYHAPQALMNAGLFGAVGGTIGIAGITGQINKKIIQEDFKNFPHITASRQGLSNLSEGTLISHDFAVLQDLKGALKEMETGVEFLNVAEAKATQKSIQLQKDTINSFQGELRVYITERLFKKENNDLAKMLLKELDNTKIGIEHGYPVLPEEYIARILGGAERAKRITEADTPVEILLARKTRDVGSKIDPGIIKDVPFKKGEIPPLPGVTGTPISDTAKVLADAAFDVTKGKAYQGIRTGLPSRIIKIAGENKGVMLEGAYPHAGDLGKIDLEKLKLGQLKIDGDAVIVAKDFDPFANTPTMSSYQFLLAHAKDAPLPSVISAKNIPEIEAAVLRGVKDVRDFNIKITDGIGLPDDLPSALRMLKDDLIIELRNEGKGVDYISRALNVPENYITGAAQGLNDPIILGSISQRALEDFTQPLFMKVEYSGIGVADRFFANGMREVQKSSQISKTQRETAAALIFGEAGKNFVPPKGALPPTPTISGAAGFATSSNGPYGSTMMIAMQSGKMVDKLAKEQAVRWIEKLTPTMQAIKNSPQDLYVRNLVATRIRAASEDMIRVPSELHPGAIETDLVLAPRSFVAEMFLKEEPLTFAELISGRGDQIVKVGMNSKEAEFLLARQELTAEQAGKWNVAFKARGRDTTFHSDAFYEPPIDTARQPFFVLVRHGNPLDDIRPLSVVVAQSADSLKTKMDLIKAQLGDQVEMFTKDQIKLNKQLEGVYDSGLLFGKTGVDSALKKNGILSDLIPRKDDYIFQEMEAWIWKQAQAINRQGVELLYGSELAELRFIEKNWAETYSSKFGAAKLETAVNPYTQVVNTFLNLSNKGNYDKLWGSINNAAQSAYATMTGAYRDAFKQATEGKLPFEEANRIAKSHGFHNATEGLTEEVFRETFKDQNSLSKLVSKVNLAAGTMMIRMDFLNSLINVMSLPVLLASESKAVRTELQKTLGMEVLIPGTTEKLPTTMKMMFDATQSFWKKDMTVVEGQQIPLKKLFEEFGTSRTNLQQIQDSFAIPLGAVSSSKEALAYGNNLVGQVAEFGTKWTGNNLAEEFVRYQAAYAGLKFAQAQGITSRGELAAYVNLFVNRVHGNYLASQRPTLFSGPVGQAISLFQTYQFNMLQQMTRHLQEGNYKSVAVAAGLQNTIFGLQGNPLFWQLNEYIGNSNGKHRDLVTSVADLTGTGGEWNDPAKWILYGLGANALQVNLYNRGDLTPRFTTIVPTAPQDIPAVSIASKAIGSFVNSIKAVGNGAPLGESILHGIAHAGFNRPLAGLASLAAGGKTTAQGTLLAAYNDFDSMTVAAKLAGGEPLNNAIAIDSYYRLQGYKSVNAKRMADLAEAVKLTNSTGDVDPEKTQEFMGKYVAKGGNIENFNKFMIGALRNSDQSIVNRVKQNTANPLAQRQLSWLGADLEDETNTSPEPTLP